MNYVRKMKNDIKDGFAWLTIFLSILGIGIVLYSYFFKHEINIKDLLLGQSISVCAYVIFRAISVLTDREDSSY